MINVLEKTIIDERTGWEYKLKDEQYYPTGRVLRNGMLTPESVEDAPEEAKSIGVWGQRHLEFIRQYKKSLYLDLFLSGKLNGYLAEINEQAEEMYSRLVKQLAQQEGVTETLKAENQILWIRRMTAITERTREIVNMEFIFI